MPKSDPDLDDRGVGPRFDRTDGELLRAYIESKSQDAIAEIVARHGPLVFGACRRVLGDGHEAEDATQATFLLLCRKAPGLTAGTALRGWLYRAAHLAAQDVRRQRRVRQKYEREAARRMAMTSREPVAGGMELNLDEALAALPARLRDAVVLRHLGGLSEAETAVELACSVRAASSRISRGLERLRRYLVRRGVPLTPAALVGLLGETRAAVMPPEVAARAVAVCTGQAAVGPSVVAVVKGVEAKLFWMKVQSASAWALGTAALAALAVALAARGAGHGSGGDRIGGSGPGAMPVAEREGAVAATMMSQPATTSAAPTGSPRLAGWPTFSAHSRAPKPEGIHLVDDLKQIRKLFETKDCHAGVGKALYGEQRRDGESLGLRVLPGGTSSPVVADGMIFISFYRPSGDVRLGGAETSFRTVGSRDGWNPDIWCIGADDCLVAIDAETGRRRWLAENAGKGLNRITIKRGDWGVSPCCHAGTVFFVGTTARVYAHDAKTGHLVWESATPAHAELEKAKVEALQKKAWGPKGDWHTGCLVAGGVLVVPTCAGGGLMGLDVGSGKTLWTLMDRKTSYQSIRATPRVWVHADREYLVATGDDGALTLVEPKTGKALWRKGGNGSNLGTVALDGDILILNVKDQPEHEGAGLWGACRLTLQGPERLWTLPDKEMYWHEWKQDKGPRPKYAVRDGLAWLAVGGAVGEENRRLLAVETTTGKILSETPMAQKEIQPQWVEDKLLVWSDLSHHNPIDLSYWTADPKGPKRLNAVLEMPGSAITGYLVPMETPYVSGRLYLRTMGGAAGFDLRK